MTVPQRAGVYPYDVDKSAYTSGSGTTVAAIIGITEKGPIDKFSFVSNWGEFLETYGTFQIGTLTPQSIKAFYDNGGQGLYVGRVTHFTDSTDITTSTAVKALDTYTGTTPAFQIEAKALTEGTHGNKYQVRILKDSKKGVITYVEEKDENNNYIVVETYDDYHTDVSTDSNYFINAVNNTSTRVRLRMISGTTIESAEFTLTLASGADGTASLADSDYQLIIDQLENITTNIPKLVAIPAVTSPTVQQYLLTKAEKLGMFAVLDTPFGISYQEAVDYRYGEGDWTSFSSFNSNYGGMYYPWLTFYDPLLNRQDILPPSGVVLGMMVNSDLNFNPWIAPAGLNRGVLKNLNGVEYSLSTNAIEFLYANQVNPIIEQKEGITVWGQKTLTTKKSAFSRINVRRLALELRSRLSELLRFACFEPNDSDLWTAIIQAATPELDNIKDSRGIEDYLLVCDETTNTPYWRNQNVVRAELYYKPINAAEFIFLGLIAASSGISFDELKKR